MCVYVWTTCISHFMYVCVCCRLITLKQFMNAMKRCAVDISDTDGLRLMLRFDTEDNQRFDTIPLIKFMRRLTYPPGNADQDNALESSFQRKNDSSFRDDNELSSGQGGGGSAESFAWKTLKKQVEARLGPRRGFLPFRRIQQRQYRPYVPAKRVRRLRLGSRGRLFTH